jgi:hypothetical protein
MRSRKRLALLSVVVGALFALLTAGVVLAQGGDLNGKFLTGSDVTVPSGTINHDVYAFGGRVTSNGTIAGELVAAAGTITVNGPVQGDVIATGGQITINGPVGGHVRAAGGQVTVNGTVAKDVLAASGQVTIGGGSTVGGDLLASGGQLQLDGTVTGSAVGTVGGYSKTGTVGGTDSITVNQQQQTPVLFQSNPVLDAIRQFIAVVLIGLLVMWLWPRAVRAAETAVRERPVPSFGWGIVAFIGYFIALIAIVIVGVILALILGALGFGGLLGIDIFATLVALLGLTLAFIVAVGFVVDAIVGLALARVVLGRSNRRPAGVIDRYGDADDLSTGRRDRWADLLPFVLGVAVVVALSAIPVIGGFVKFIVVLLGLGAIVLAIWRRPRTDRYVPTPTGAAPPPDVAGA